MQVNPSRLLVLRAVVDAGGVVAAGRRLHLAPSGVSQHLAALERETGLILVDRSRRGGQRSLRLTAAGLRLAGHAARLAEVLEDAQADVVASTGAVHGRSPSPRSRPRSTGSWSPPSPPSPPRTRGSSPGWSSSTTTR